MRSFSLIMLASVIEGLPLSFIEAMAMGVPVVSTDLEGIPELVDDEVGACVRNAKSDARRLRSLVDAGLNVLENDSERGAMSVRARERVRKHFGIEQMRADYLSAFHDLLERNKSIADSRHG
jgi:glycosyltransferase involved in cell wall biosynthesis